MPATMRGVATDSSGASTDGPFCGLGSHAENRCSAADQPKQLSIPGCRASQRRVPPPQTSKSCSSNVADILQLHCQ